ncbi:MAG: response regulator transcription factor [Spirochaetales bacterium]|nr:response regulator transcription factor [Spirochaetales bacterium]
MTENDRPKRILIVEDDKEISQVVAMNIEDLGFETTQVHDGRTGLRLAGESRFDLIILDIMLPQLDGISLCRSIREGDPFTPIMMLTAKAEEIDRVMGLELGADDYMTKPFSLRELTARVKALLRRAQAVPPEVRETEGPEKILHGDLMVDAVKRRVTLKGRELDLTVKEYELLTLFAQNPGRAFSRSDLLNLVWGYQFQGYEHTVNTHINRLRNKIEKDPSHPVYLETVWGVGYRFSEEAP